MGSRRSFSTLVSSRLKDGPHSLRKVCRESGLDPSYFSKAARGKCPPPTDEKILIKLAKVLDLDPLALIISTGMIPSALRDAMDNPEIVKRLLLSRETKTPKAWPAPRPRVRTQEPSASAPISRSPELSTDLL